MVAPIAGGAIASSAIAASSEELLAFTLAADSGSYLITGTDAALSVSANKSIITDSGSYSISGSSVGFIASKLLSVDGGAYAISGAPLGLVKSADASITADAGSYLFTGSSLNLSTTSATKLTIVDWGTTPNLNTALFPENMTRPTVNNSFREAQARIRGTVECYPIFEFSESITFVSENSFSTAGNVTQYITTGARLRVVGTSTGEIFGTVTSTSFSDVTTISAEWDSGSLVNEDLRVWKDAMHGSEQISREARLTAVETGVANQTFDFIEEQKPSAVQYAEFTGLDDYDILKFSITGMPTAVGDFFVHVGNSSGYITSMVYDWTSFGRSWGPAGNSSIATDQFSQEKADLNRRAITATGSVPFTSNLTVDNLASGSNTTGVCKSNYIADLTGNYETMDGSFIVNDTSAIDRIRFSFDSTTWASGVITLKGRKI